MKNLLCILFVVTLGSLSFAGNSDKEKTSSRIVTGRITDAYGETLPGAQIRVAETGETIFADMDGNFRLSLKTDKDYSVTVNTLGYQPLEIKASRLPGFADLSLKPL